MLPVTDTELLKVFFMNATKRPYRQNCSHAAIVTALTFSMDSKYVGTLCSTWQTAPYLPITTVLWCGSGISNS